MLLGLPIHGLITVHTGSTCTCRINSILHYVHILFSSLSLSLSFHCSNVLIVSLSLSQSAWLLDLWLVERELCLKFKKEALSKFELPIILFIANVSKKRIFFSIKLIIDIRAANNFIHSQRKSKKGIFFSIKLIIDII